jgi:NAD+ synthase (glutamine-hydrolysing)
MKIALAQINTIVGDVDYNLAKAEEYIKVAHQAGADVVLLPELVTTGYPPRDLLYRKDLISRNIRAKDFLVELTRTIPVVIAFGYVERTETDGMKPLYNAACIAQNGKVLQTRFKTLLPTYDVFEEYRYFEPGPHRFEPVDVKGVKVGLIICEEAWNDKNFWQKHLYSFDPVSEMAKAGAEYIFCLNSSPYRKGVADVRRKMIAQHCKSNHVGFAYVNQVGFNDEVGFDGNSFTMNSNGDVVSRCTPFIEVLDIVDTESAKPLPTSLLDIPWQEEVLGALRLGVKDYFGKLGFTGPAIVGLSGGIDSAIVAFIAREALGTNRILGVGMPSEFSSPGSISDAEKIAKKLGIRFVVEPIAKQHDGMRVAIDNINESLYREHASNPYKRATPLFNREFVKCQDAGVTDENLQARIRGIYLMGLANYYNGLVLSTSNKSESAVGYTTLYGDMCGGLAVISDLPKTMIFELCSYINLVSREEIIPWNTINKPPSAELRADQKDSDSLPPYETLDAILYRFVDEAKCPREIIDEMATVTAEVKYLSETNRNLKEDIIWVCNAVSRNEYKRKQSPTGLKVSAKLFKYGWQMPIVHRLPAL